MKNVYNKVLLIILLILLMLPLLSCRSQEGGYVGMNFDSVNNVLKNDYKSITKIYEYSYISDKGRIIKINDLNDNIAQVFISLGKPNEVANEDFGSSFVKDFNEQVFTINNSENLYRIDDKCVSQKKFPSLKRPYWFDIDSGYIYYIIASPDFSLYKSSIEGADSPIVIGNDVLIKGTNLSGGDTWNSLSVINFRNNFIAINGHIFYKANDEKLYRMTGNGNENTLLTSDDKVFNIKYFNGWIYYLDYKFELKRIRPDGSNPEIVANGIFIKDYEIDEKNNDIVLQTDNDMFYLVTTDCKLSKIDYSISNFIKQKRVDYESINLVGFEQNKVFLFINADLSSDNNKDYIISFDIDTPGSQQTILIDYIDTGTTYWPRLLDNYIYYYNYETAKFYRIDINTLDIEQIGDEFQHENNWENSDTGQTNILN